MIHLTENAVKELKKVIKEQDVKEEYLRVGCTGGGCSGLSYAIGFDAERDETDHLFEQDELRILVDDLSYTYIKGTTVDFVKDLSRMGFAFENPLAARSCGCNKSFTPKDFETPTTGSCGTGCCGS